jgi:uncharacterized membrane protein (DUF2068 family)
MGNRPLGITIIAIVLAISGVANIVLGLVGMDILKLDLGTLAAGAQAAGAGALVSGVLTLIVAWGMFATTGWAWLLAVIVMVVRILVDVWAIITHGIGSSLAWAGLVNLAISAVILWYFNRPNVRSAFGR